MARSVRAELRHAVRVQPSALAAERAVADARSHRDVAAEWAASARLWEASAARGLRADEPAARGPGATAGHEAAARDGPRAPAVRPAGAEVPPSALEGAQLLAALAVRPSEALAATVSEQARLPGPSADRAPPAPSKTMTLARRGQIAKRKTRRSQAIPISDSSCPSLLLESCLSNRVHDASIGDVSCP